MHEWSYYHENELFVVLIDIVDFKVTSRDTKPDSWFIMIIYNHFQNLFQSHGII